MFSVIISAMEATSQYSTYFAILPVSLVVVLAILVFAFGFKSSPEPPSFKHINTLVDERKSIKKKRVKDKKPQANGNATAVGDVAEKKAETPKPVKQAKVETPKAKKNVDAVQVADKKPEGQKSPVKKDKKPSEGKAKKNVDLNVKPADFDEGEWEVAPSRKDKKKQKKEEDPLPAYTPPTPNKKVAAAKKDDQVKTVDAQGMETVRLEDILPNAAPELKEAFKIPTTSTPEPEIVAAPVPQPEVVPAPEPEPVLVEEPAKKKKAKKPKVSTSEEEVVVAAPEPVAPSGEPEVEATAAPLVFNELEDSWKEAPQKKSKKKARKD